MIIPKALTASAVVLVLSFGKTNPAASNAPAEGPAVLWRNPADIASRNLYYGPGGKAHEPQGTFTFDKEDMNGTSPKFDVTDQDGVKWRVKMGDEARPETVASRLVWAAGYFANEDYFMPELHVENMGRLRRGGNMVSRDGSVRNVRLKRHIKNEKKIGIWSWANNPFTGTREWYGLQALMALMNNWDLKDLNNSVYQISGGAPQQVYMVSDLGSSFGSIGLNWMAKGNLKTYAHSKWIGHVSADSIDFNVPSRPALLTFFNMPDMVQRLGMCWIGRHVPLADARWIGHLLGQLSEDQVRDAFRAAGYSSHEIEEFTQVVERRIRELEAL
jgi:hypothetical protein